MLNRYFSTLHLPWWVNVFLQLIGISRVGTHTVISNNQSSLIKLDNRIRPGWYMLEVKLRFDTTRIKSRVVYSDCSNHSEIKSVGFPLYAGQVNKRIIYLPRLSNVCLDLPLNEHNFFLLSLKLLPISKKFSSARMIKKLFALHPCFKNSTTLTEYLKSTSIDDPLQYTWRNYSALFEDKSELVSYANWLQEFDDVKLNNQNYKSMEVRITDVYPLISIVLQVDNSQFECLEKTIFSVIHQNYQNWELIVNAADCNKKILKSIVVLCENIQRIKFTINNVNHGNGSNLINSAINIAKGDWLVLLDHDDLLPSYALDYIAETIKQHPEVKLIYSDEDKIDESGMRSDAYFKPDWNQDLFYSQNMFSHLGVYHTDLVRKVGGFREGFEGSQDYDLALRCIEHIRADQIHHIPRVLYHWRIHADSTAHSMDAKPYAMIAGERALNEHFARVGVDAQVESVGYGYRVRYALPAILPLVSLLIPTRNGLKLLKQCVHSILTKTDYANYEILIIDNGSDDSATLRYLKKLGDDARIRVIRDDGPFNYSALNNAAVKLAKGEIIGLINNDVEVINPDWLSEMVSHVLRPEVGAVGARLWYSDDTLQHAGVILGVHGIAGHAHRFLPRGNVGYCGRAALTQSFSAVTAACMLVRKAVYEEMGGLNEVELQVACNDVDFCLRLREAGYRNIWTPYAELYHHESASRGFDDTPEKQARSAKEVAYMQQRWGDALWTDPAYNPNLSLDNEDFTLAWPPRIDMASH